MNTPDENTIFSHSAKSTEGFHVCHIYNEDRERAKMMAEFFKEALNEGNKILCVVDTISPHEISEELDHLGIDPQTIETGFVKIDNESAYNPSGNFDPDSVLTNIGSYVKQAKQDGFTGLHISGDMAWVLRDKISTPQLMEYETKVLDYQKITPCTAICEYDARKFDGGLIMDILSVHPLMLVRGQIVKNPFFITPKEFLRQYDARRGH